MTDVKIGSPCWLFSENNRSYDGRRRLIWRKHWVEAEIVGETRVSWIVEGRPHCKIDKKTLQIRQKGDGFGPKRVVWSKKELDGVCWVHENRYHILEELRYKDFDQATWVAIAKLIDFEAMP